MEGVLDVTLPHDAEVTHHLKRREDRGCTGKWEREGGRGGTGKGRWEEWGTGEGRWEWGTRGKMGAGKGGGRRGGRGLTRMAVSRSM